MLRIIRQPILDIINRPRPFTVIAAFISHFSHPAMINFLFILIVCEHIFISLKYLFYLVLKSREVLMTLHLMLRSLHPFLVAFLAILHSIKIQTQSAGIFKSFFAASFYWQRIYLLPSKIKHLFAWINVINILINVYC